MSVILETVVVTSKGYIQRQTSSKSLAKPRRLRQPITADAALDRDGRAADTRQLTPSSGFRNKKPIRYFVMPRCRRVSTTCRNLMPKGR